MDLSYFRKINNTYNFSSRQESDLYLLNRHIDDCFADTIDYHIVKRNGEPFELLIIKDTDSNVFRKKIKSKNSNPFNLGDYIEWDGKMWIVMLLDSDDKTYHSGYMYFCPLLLRWQNSTGKIVERWTYVEDFTKYATGERGSGAITLGENQYGVHLPIDEETKGIKRGQRFPVDLDGIDPPDIYRLTNRKIFLNDNSCISRGGIITWTLSFDFFNEDTDKKILLDTGKYCWIADYIDISDGDEEDIDYSIEISYRGNKSIVVGGNYKTFTAVVTDSSGEAIDNTNVSWSVTTLSENEEFIVYEITDSNSIKIKSLYNKDLLGSQILLTASLGAISSSIYIELGGGI